MSSRPTWSDFYDEGLGPQLPLTPEQRVSPVSGVLPSGEGGGFDYSQHLKPINQPFPYPNLSTPQILAFSDGQLKSNFPEQFGDDWWDASGVLKTYSPTSGELLNELTEGTVFHFDGFASRFSNASASKFFQIEDFRIFNPYIHHG